MFDLSKSLRPSPTYRAGRPPLFGLPLRLFRGSSSRLCLVLSDIGHSNSLRSPSAFCSLHPYLLSTSPTPCARVHPSFRRTAIHPAPALLLFFSFPRDTRRGDTKRRIVDSCFAIHSSRAIHSCLHPLDVAASRASSRRGCVGHGLDVLFAFRESSIEYGRYRVRQSVI